jgi:hypothetical protein
MACACSRLLCMRRQICLLLRLQFLNAVVDWINDNKGGRASFVMNTHFYANLMNILYKEGRLVTVPKYDYTKVRKWPKRLKVCHAAVAF